MKYYFIDNEIYYQNQKMPPRKIQLFFVEEKEDYYVGYDIDGNEYNIEKNKIIKEI